MTSKTNSSSAKDTIYIDVDDEITAVIDKVQASKQRIVALVLPKRAAAFQSIVNMKLLKRSADHAKKHVVLITADASLLPLAGDVGLRVAKSLQSKPEVPDGPEPMSDTDDKPEAVEESDEPPLDKSKTLAELNQDEEETIELDEPDEEEQQDAGKSDKKGKKAGKGGGKKFKIPNFNRFRLLLLGGAAALILLIVAGVMAFAVLPKARIVVSTDSSAINVSQDLNLRTGEDVQLNVEEAVVPATKEETKKTVSKEVPASGQENKGEKATGKVTLALKDCSKNQVTVPAGTGVSANGKTFITQASATLKSVEIGGDCENSSFPNQSTKTVAVISQTGGAANNIGPSSFTVAGYSNVSGKSSSAMTGGTDNIIKIVSQADIDKAKEQIGTQDSEAVRSELAQALQDAGLMPIKSTFTTTTPTTNQSANVGDEADSVTVTQEVVYSMLGVKREDLEKLAAEQVNTEIDPTKQSILDYGFDEAAFTSLKTEADSATVGFQTTVIAGTDLNADEIKEQVAGKKANDAKELIKENPGVTEVEVTYSPFWVSAIPEKTSKITVIIEEPRLIENDAQSEPESSQ